MKKLSFAMLLSLIAVFSFVACSEDSHNYPVKDNTVTPIKPKDISNVTAESGPRSVILRWETPADANISYVEVKYYHPRIKDTVTCKGGAFNDSVEVTGLVPSYGEIEFALRTVSKTGDKGAVTKTSGVAGKLPVLESYNEVELRVKGEDVNSNNIEPTEGSIANLFDGSLDSYFHSKWSGDAAEVWARETCWLSVDLKGEYTSLDWRFTNRSNANGVPKKVDVYGSMNGTEWELMKTIEDTGAPQKGSAVTTVRGIKYEGDNAGKAFSHLKFWVRTVQNSTHTYICLAEFRLITLEKKIEDPNNDGWGEIPAPAEEEETPAE